MYPNLSAEDAFTFGFVVTLCTVVALSTGIIDPKVAENVFSFKTLLTFANNSVSPARTTTRVPLIKLCGAAHVILYDLLLVSISSVASTLNEGETL
jgi:hypothetical protein